SVAGSQMQFVALNWHIYQLTHSPIALGLIGLFRVVPIVAFARFGGLVADAWDRRRVLFATQTFLAFISAALGILTYTGRISAASIYILTAIGAAATAFNGPARQAIVAIRVAPENLANAMSLSSVTHQLASIVGPMVAGILLAQSRLDAVYMLNAATFVIVILALAAIDPMSTRRALESRSDMSLSAMKEGLRFVLRTPILV